MQIKNPLHKTKNFFQKNLENIRYVLFGKHQKAHKPSSLNPFSCSTWNPKSPQSAQVYSDFFEDWKQDRDGHIITAQKQLPINEEDTNRANITKLEKQSPERRSSKERNVKEKKTARSHLRKGEDLSSKSLSKGSIGLAKKMKEWDVVEGGDLEQVLDIEEASHYYSRLKSPVYIDIVDKFFTDMYSELSASKPASSINSSKRRMGSLRF